MARKVELVAASVDPIQWIAAFPNVASHHVRHLVSYAHDKTIASNLKENVTCEKRWLLSRVEK